MKILVTMIKEILLMDNQVPLIYHSVCITKRSSIFCTDASSNEVSDIEKNVTTSRKDTCHTIESAVGMAGIHNSKKPTPTGSNHEIGEKMGD